MSMIISALNQARRVGGPSVGKTAARSAAMHAFNPMGRMGRQGAAAAVTRSSSGMRGSANSILGSVLPQGSARRRIMLGTAGTRGRRARVGMGIGVGGAMGMNAVLGPRAPSSGATGLRPGGSQLPY